MSFKYNILWLDDEPIKALKTIQEANPNVNFEKIDYVDECEVKLSTQSEMYHAVILDANGVSSSAPEKDANKSGFLSLVRHVIDCKIPLYIYSGQLLRASDGDIVDVVLEELLNFGLEENIFQKSSAPYEMIDKILSDLNSNYQYYQGHEYILDFFSKGWIEKKFKSAQFDPIMKYYKNHDIDSAHGNQMRQSVEQMLECINSILNITDVKKDRTSSIINGLAHSFSRYSTAIVGALKHMDEMANEESHNALDEDIRELFFMSDFSTFFLITNWFYNLMLRLEKDGFTNTIEQQVEETSPNPIDSIQNNQKLRKPERERKYDGIYEEPYRENGCTYVDLKVKVIYGDRSLINMPGKVFVTGIQKDKYSEGSWVTYPIDSIEKPDYAQLNSPKSSEFK